MHMKILIEICFSHSRKIVELEDEVKLVKDPVDWISGSTHSHRGQ